MKQTLYLIRGVPGSGKSSFAYNLEDADVVQYVLEADLFFTHPTTKEYLFDASKLKQAHEWCQKTTIRLLNNGNSVAVSNTSTTEKEVETYRKIAEECNANFVSLIVENRHNGVNIHTVPEDKIQQMKQRFSVKL